MNIVDIEGAGKLEKALNDNDMLPVEIIGIAVRGSIFSVAYDRDISFGFDMWTVDSSGQSFQMTIAGTAGEQLDIYWGDGSNDSYIFTGGNQLISHPYDPGQFLQRWDVNELAITYLNAPTQSLIGDIPLAIQKFHRLTHLYIYSNQLTGDLSGWATELANWGNIQFFQIDSNNFTGDLSGWSIALVNWTNIIQFQISLNNFTGDLSAWNTILADWVNIKEFQIFSNNFIGDLSGWSSSLVYWGNIQFFQIGSNNFTGDLSGWAAFLNNWANIVWFYIHNNDISSIGVDNCHIGLDDSESINGIAVIVSGNNPRTPASDEAYNSLISKGWNLS